MTRKGYIKQIDDKNTIEIPKELLEKLGISNGCELEVFIEDGLIKIGKIS